MEDEGFDRPFRFIATGQYLAVHYHDGRFELCRDYHTRGTLFYLSDDEEQIIHGRTYIGALAEHPDYPGDVFYIRQGSQYLAQDGRWTERVDDAVIVQLDPQSDCGDADAETALPPPLPAPIVEAENPISADGIDLFLPEKWFSLYPITGDCLWLGDAGEFQDMLYFGGNPYSLGMGFQLSKHEGKIRIRSMEGRYLTVMMDAGVAEYLDESCRQHTWRDQCPRCTRCYSLGFSSEPQECLSLVPTGLPSMFVLYDGLSYYQVSALKGSFATVVRVDSMTAATVFQFVA
ncbi:hypothetical protein BJX96DRAFT_8074 [Aspergillus floccosus]